MSPRCRRASKTTGGIPGSARVIPNFGPAAIGEIDDEGPALGSQDVARDVPPVSRAGTGPIAEARPCSGAMTHEQPGAGSNPSGDRPAGFGPAIRLEGPAASLATSDTSRSSMRRVEMR